MVFFKRRRLIGWLIKAYLRRWGKYILLSFGIGLLIFALVIANMGFILSKIPIAQETSIGIVGSYSADNLPPSILDKVSQGLTSVSSDGTIHPAAATSWEIKDKGQTYVFHINTNLKFTDGQALNSSLVNYNFSDAEISKPDKSTLIIRLTKGPYSPFLLTVSNRKIFKDNLIGIGEYKVVDLKLNGDFIQSVKIQSAKNPNIKYTYKFFDTQETMKTSFILGEIDQMGGINKLDYGNMSLDQFKNVNIKKETDFTKLVTLFYDNQDKDLSDKKVRKALSYAIPNNFVEGQRNFTPYNPNIWASEKITNPYEQDYAHSKLLLSQNSSESAKISLTIKTLPQYKTVADAVAAAWEQIGVKTKIEEVDSVPSTFQVYLGDFPVLKDPDQYSIWHTGQASNISNYRNLRIDKLLEDGRKISSLEERKKIYADFQKYLLDDSPATFLFFPYSYTVTRK